MAETRTHPLRLGPCRVQLCMARERVQPGYACAPGAENDLVCLADKALAFMRLPEEPIRRDLTVISLTANTRSPNEL